MLWQSTSRRFLLPMLALMWQHQACCGLWSVEVHRELHRHNSSNSSSSSSSICTSSLAVKTVGGRMSSNRRALAPNGRDVVKDSS